MDLGPETSFWTSGKCNPEQNDFPGPFLTSILVPDGLKALFLWQWFPHQCMALLGALALGTLII